VLHPVQGERTKRSPPSVELCACGGAPLSWGYSWPLQSVLDALRARRERFVFEGSEIALRPSGECPAVWLRSSGSADSVLTTFRAIRCRHMPLPCPHNAASTALLGCLQPWPSSP
jgi:hypothetical protein